MRMRGITTDAIMSNAVGRALARTDGYAAPIRSGRPMCRPVVICGFSLFGKLGQIRGMHCQQFIEYLGCGLVAVDRWIKQERLECRLPIPMNGRLDGPILNGHLLAQQCRNCGRQCRNL